VDLNNRIIGILASDARLKAFCRGLGPGGGEKGEAEDYSQAESSLLRARAAQL
jgi:hypothetical protein